MSSDVFYRRNIQNKFVAEVYEGVDVIGSSNFRERLITEKESKRMELDEILMEVCPIEEYSLIKKARGCNSSYLMLLQ